MRIQKLAAYQNKRSLKYLTTMKCGDTPTSTAVHSSGGATDDPSYIFATASLYDDL